MFSINVFCCVVFLYTVISMDADPMRCYRQHEILDCVQACPPERTCKNREIRFNCLQNVLPCRPKCVCQKGYYRNVIGECISEEDCAKCPARNEYFSCGQECDNVCSELHLQNQTNCPIVNVVCNKKCYCEEDFARDEHGNCIPISDCPDTVCGPNEEYTDCKKSCPPETCYSFICDLREKCRPGCACKPSYLRKTEDAPCMPLRDCRYKLNGSPDFD